MTFVDDITLTLSSGDGGDGVVRFSSIRGKALAGPSGGNGGKGGDVLLRGVRDVGMLRSYRHIKEKVAQKGGNGQKESMHGKDGDDLFIDVPVGSVVSVYVDQDSTEPTTVYEVLTDGELIKILPGGRGGLGNEHFKGSTNRSPRQSTKGSSGLSARIHIELRLIANFGLVGTPNSGKTTLLNTLTKADAKVGNYAFTTLTPNLGVIYGKVIADIPGLIEGASEGKGLGHEFLKHITRVNTLIFCISVEREEPLEEFAMLRKELSEYSDLLNKKPALVVFTKVDMLMDEAPIKKAEEHFKKIGIATIRLSAITGEGIEALKNFIKSTT